MFSPPFNPSHLDHPPTEELEMTNPFLCFFITTISQGLLQALFIKAVSFQEIEFLRTQFFQQKNSIILTKQYLNEIE